MMIPTLLLATLVSAPDTADAIPSDVTSQAILAAIAEERDDLAAQKAEVDAAKADLKRAEEQLDERITKLEKLLAERTAVEKGIVAARKLILGDRTKRLMEIAGKMKPERAAAYLAGLDENVAVSILAGMSPRKAAKILSALPDSKTSSLSRLYLTREPLGEPTDQPRSDAPEQPEP